MNKTEFNYVIERHYGTVSVNNDYSKELCRIKWRNGGPKLDFRLWRDFSDEGKRTPMKGISISLEEAEILKELLNNAF